MLLTISTNGKHAPDLGFLLHKHPDRFQSFPIRFGQCHVFYPESNPTKSTVCLLLDIDSVEMARSKRGYTPFALSSYVNDRPFVASSLMSSAITSAFGSALNGTCSKRPELVERKWDVEVSIDVLPVRGGEAFLRKAFEPLGYEVIAEPIELDDKYPEWGPSRYFAVTLKANVTIEHLLSHLYVLIPVFDLQKHYFSGRDELDKLLAKGEAWLATHPEKESIVNRYLKFQRGLRRAALDRLTTEVEQVAEDPDTAATEADTSEEKLERKISLHEVRLETVEAKILECGAQRVIDLGCGEGKLLRRLLKQWQLKEIVGVDVAVRTLEIAAKRLKLDELPSFQASRIKLLHGSLMYRDRRFEKYDVAAIVEVIEHLDEPRLSAFERVVFRHARPRVAIVTTPNSEYNVMWPTLPAGKFRHADHRFEWTRAEFNTWCDSIAERFGYSVELFPIGPEEENIGAPSQMAVFKIEEPKPAPKHDRQSESTEKHAPANDGGDV